MSIPIICLDARLRQFCETFRKCFSQPQFKYLVTVLLALMLCQETHTLTGLLRCLMSKFAGQIRGVE